MEMEIERLMAQWPTEIDQALSNEEVYFLINIDVLPSLARHGSDIKRIFEIVLYSTRYSCN
jgi:hypothetical protein